MVNYIILFLIIGGYIGLSYITTRLIRKWTRNTSRCVRLASISFSYALFFGIGIIASGGDPGFGFPCPVIVAGILGIIAWIPFDIYLSGVILPLTFWWILIFIIMLFKSRKVMSAEIDENK